MDPELQIMEYCENINHEDILRDDDVFQSIIDSYKKIIAINPMAIFIIRDQLVSFSQLLEIKPLRWIESSEEALLNELMQHDLSIQLTPEKRLKLHVKLKIRKNPQLKIFSKEED